MKIAEIIANCFTTGIERILESEGKTQTWLAKKSKISKTEINDLLRKRKNFSLNRMGKLSEVLRRDFFEILDLGRGKQAGRDFFFMPLRNREYAEKISSKLLQIEKIDPLEIERIFRFLKFTLNECERRIKDRRRADIGPPDGIERRNGFDRRKSASGEN